jgi:hypothetical protein
MALDYDFGGIAKETRTVVAAWDEPFNGIKKGDLLINPVSKAIVFATMSVGIGEITEANYAEFYKRLRFYEALFGHVLSFGEGPLKGARITVQDIKDHIGLRTNVFPKESDAKWHKRIMESFNSDINWQVKEVNKEGPKQRTLTEAYKEFLAKYEPEKEGE